MLRDDIWAGRDQKHSILVVDDDPAITDLLAVTMTRAGYDVRCACSASDALHAIELRQPDLLLLDVDLPDGDGLELLRRLRRVQASTIGVIVISGRATEHQRLAGFAAGADDYVTKPFSPREVAARAAGILRRMAIRPSEPSATLLGGPLRIEPMARRVTCHDAPVDLTKLEYRLLLDLVSRPDIVRTREQLIDAAWGAEWLADASTVTVHIQRLRGKLVAAGCERDLIQTVRGFGYRFAPSTAQTAPSLQTASDQRRKQGDAGLAVTTPRRRPAAAGVPTRRWAA